MNVDDESPGLAESDGEMVMTQSTSGKASSKKAVHVKWAGKTIALGTFPAEEAEEKCARAKALTRAWRSTMRPKPTREWVMLELERLQVRVVSGRVNDRSASANSGPEPTGVSMKRSNDRHSDTGLSLQQGDSETATRHRKVHRKAMRRGSITETVLSQGGPRDWLEKDSDNVFTRNNSFLPSQRLSSMSWMNQGLGLGGVSANYDRRNSLDQLAAAAQLSEAVPLHTYDTAAVTATNPQLSTTISTSGAPSTTTTTTTTTSTQQQEQPMTKNESGVPMPAHRPLVGGGSAAAYEAAREEHYRMLAEEKKKKEDDKKHNMETVGETSLSSSVANAASDADPTIEKDPFKLKERDNDNRIRSSSFAAPAPRKPSPSSQKQQQHFSSIAGPPYSNSTINKDNVNNSLSMNDHRRGSLPGFGTQRSSLLGGGANTRNNNAPPPGSSILGQGLSTSSQQHYEMLKLHQQNLVSELRETTLMMNLYEQQLLLEQQGRGAPASLPPSLHGLTPDMQNLSRRQSSIGLGLGLNKSVLPGVDPLSSSLGYAGTGGAPGTSALDRNAMRLNSLAPGGDGVGGISGGSSLFDPLGGGGGGGYNSNPDPRRTSGIGNLDPFDIDYRTKSGVMNDVMPFNRRMSDFSMHLAGSSGLGQSLGGGGDFDDKGGRSSYGAAPNHHPYPPQSTNSSKIGYENSSQERNNNMYARSNNANPLSNNSSSIGLSMQKPNDLPYEHQIKRQRLDPPPTSRNSPNGLISSSSGSGLNVNRESV